MSETHTLYIGTRYLYVESVHLKWVARRRLILKEITEARADVRSVYRVY